MSQLVHAYGTDANANGFYQGASVDLHRASSVLNLCLYQKWNDDDDDDDDQKKKHQTGDTNREKVDCNLRCGVCFQADQMQTNTGERDETAITTMIISTHTAPEKSLIQILFKYYTIRFLLTLSSEKNSQHWPEQPLHHIAM